MSTTVVSDKNVVRGYAVVWILGYLFVYFFLKNYLPDEYFRDSLVIQKLALKSDNSDWGGAYAIAAFIARVLPDFVIKGLVALLGCFTIWYVTQSLKTIRGMLIIVPTLVPFIILNMMDFGKESFVIPLSFLILWATKRSKTIFHAFGTIFLIYLLYGLFFRPYYLIILAAFIGLVVLDRISTPLRLLLVLVVVMALFVLPSQMFMDLQGDRDRINYLANIVYPVVHTAIMNPLPPNSAFNFIINYMYAAYRLMIPIAARQSPSDFVLFYNIFFFGNLLHYGIKHRAMGNVSLLPFLFIAHVLVLFIFEPDSGSYLRHASSILIYLLPSLRLIEETHAEEVMKKKKKEQEDRRMGVPLDTTHFLSGGS